MFNNIQPDLTLKACNTVISSAINCVAYVPPNQNRRTGSSMKNHRSQYKQHKHECIVKQEAFSVLKNSESQLTVDSLLDIDSSDDDDTTTTIHNEDTCSSDRIISSFQCVLFENGRNTEQQDTRESTMWLGTDDGVFVSFICH